MDSYSFLVSFTAFSCWFTSVLGRTVDLSDGEFFEVPHAQITSNKTTIEELLLDHNLLTELGDGEFSDYQNLHILNLMLNRLVNISDSAFEGTQLSELDIGYNSLSVLPAFSGVGATLTKLYAGHNVLVDISGLSSLTALIELDLRQNQFVSISEIPKTTIQTLYMAGNVGFDFAGAYRELNQFETLETLFITYFSEHIRSVPDLANLTSLRVLDLRGNHLERIANLTLVNLPSTITELVLRECKLTSVPDFGEELAASLEILDLRVNDITDYGVEALSALTNLRALKLAYNPLVRWPDFSYVGTKNAHPRKLIMNGITTLPALYNTTFCHFHNIHLVGNMLTEYPDLTACRNKANTTLSLLNLKQNNINESADTSVIGGIASLAIIILDNNPFRRLPNLVSSEFPGLAIYLRNNKLGSVAENLLSDRHFHSLHLSGNDFKEPPYGVIAHTTILDLSSNAILIMDALRINLAICENVLLHSLDLSDNYLGDILDVPNLKESLCFHKTEKTIILEGVAAAPSCPCRLRWLAAVRRDCPHVTIQLDSATPCEDAADWAQFDALMATCDGTELT